MVHTADKASGVTLHSLYNALAPGKEPGDFQEETGEPITYFKTPNRNPSISSSSSLVKLGEPASDIKKKYFQKEMKLILSQSKHH